MEPQTLVPIVALCLTAGLVHQWLKYLMRLNELRHASPVELNSSIRAEFESLRDEVRQLRDTATQYDLSFDTALQRIEGRVEALERRSYAHAAAEAPTEVRLRG